VKEDDKKEDNKKEDDKKEDDQKEDNRKDNRRSMRRKGQLIFFSRFGQLHIADFCSFQKCNSGIALFAPLFKKGIV